MAAHTCTIGPIMPEPMTLLRACATAIIISMEIPVKDSRITLAKIGEQNPQIIKKLRIPFLLEAVVIAHTIRQINSIRHNAVRKKRVERMKQRLRRKFKGSFLSFHLNI